MTLVPQNHGALAKTVNNGGLATLPTAITVACEQTRISRDFIHSKRSKKLRLPFTKWQQTTVADQLNNIAAAADAVEGYCLQRVHLTESMASIFETLLAVRDKQHERVLEYMDKMPSSGLVPALPSEVPLFEAAIRAGEKILAYDDRAMGLIQTYNDLTRRLETYVSEHGISIPQDIPLPKPINLIR